MAGGLVYPLSAVAVRLVSGADERARVPWTAVDLPSVAEPGCEDPTTADMETVNNALDALEGDEPALLVGHSRGGLVVAETGIHERVGHIAYIGGADLLDGQALPDILGDSGLLTAMISRPELVASLLIGLTVG